MKICTFHVLVLGHWTKLNQKVAFMTQPTELFLSELNAVTGIQFIWSY